MTTLERIKKYREVDSLSQSELKALLSGKSFKKKPSLVQTIGSYIDCIITCSEIKDDLFFITNASRPTDKIVELCASFYNWIEQAVIGYTNPFYNELEKHKDEIEHWLEFQSYYNNRPKTRVNTFIEEAKEWWTVLVQREDRQIITTVEELEAELMLLNLQRDMRWDWISKGEFQKDFYWNEEGVACKGLGDICFDDVYIDIKYTTCPNPREWMKVCANLNYPFQMAFYKSGLGFKKGYWLVVHKDWHELIEVEDIMYQTGKWGYDKKQTIRIGKVEFDTWIHTPGYIDGINLVKGLPLTNFNQLYLSYL